MMLLFCNTLNLRLGSEPCSIVVGKNKDDYYEFWLKFTNSEYDFKAVIHRREADYLPLSWLKEDIDWCISVGLIVNGKNYKFCPEKYELNKLFLN